MKPIYAEMPSVNCPVPKCTYVTTDNDAVIVAALLTTHATLHKALAAAGASVKVNKVKRSSLPAHRKTGLIS